MILTAESPPPRETVRCGACGLLVYEDEPDDMCCRCYNNCPDCDCICADLGPGDEVVSALGNAIARLRTTQLVYLVHARIPDAPIIVETVEDYIQRGDHACPVDTPEPIL